MLPAVRDEGGLEGLGSSPTTDDQKPTACDMRRLRTQLIEIARNTDAICCL